MRRIAVVGLFFVGSAVVAQTVTFRTDDNSVALDGRFVAFDGHVVTLFTDDGLASFRADDMVCDGADCPNMATFVPRLRMVGASRMGDLLIPALIDVYARDNGWLVVEEDGAFELRSDDDAAVFRISIEIAAPDVAFERFSNHSADALLSLRELRHTEIQQGRDAGLGQLTLARQARIVALDALVPVVSPSSDLVSISLAELTKALSGQPSPFELYLPEQMSGHLEGFEDRFMRPFGMSIVSGQASVLERGDLAETVVQADNGLSVLPYGATGNAQALSLSGSCGLVSTARFLTMKTEDYPLTFPMFLYLPQRTQHPQVEDFLDWLRSASAQLVIRRAGFVDLAAVPIPLANQGVRLANAIANAGEEVPLDELKRLVEVLSPRVRMSSTFRFEPGSTRLDGQSRSNVMQLAQAIRDGRFAGRELMFVGFSDGLGPAEDNRDLSSARAEAVRRDVVRALAGRLPDNVAIDVESFGEALPMACDDTVWGQQTNRRVELWVRDAD